MKVGTEKEEFFKYLKLLEDNTSIDSILTSGQTLNLTLHRGRKGLKWSALEGVNKKSFGYSHGKKLNDFFDAIKNLDEEHKMDYMDVMVLKESDPVKTWEGKIKCQFYEIDPFQPYTIEENGSIYIPITEMELFEYEYEAVQETRLGLYDFTYLYPFRKIAVQSIGSFLDSRGLLKDTEAMPLSQGLVIAERLSEKQSFSILTRGLSDVVKPIIELSVYKERIPSQIEFFNNCMNYCARQGVYTCGNWKISDDFSQIDIYPIMFTIYQPVIRLQTSDVTGVGWTVKAFAKIGPGKVEIKSNTLKRNKTMDMDLLFQGIYESLKKFDENLRANISYSIKPEDFNGIKGIIGKKRAERHDYLSKSHSGSGNLYDLSNKIIENSFETLPAELNARLEKEYYEVISNIRKSHE